LIYLTKYFSMLEITENLGNRRGSSGLWCMVKRETVKLKSLILISMDIRSADDGS